jgi:hypothetical protein
LKVDGVRAAPSQAAIRIIPDGCLRMLLADGNGFHCFPPT